MDRSRAAITETLRQRIVAGLHLGALETGDRLPSLRQVGAELHADPRMVLAAYRQLAAEGLVRLRPRSGVFVQSWPRPGEGVLPDVASWIVDVFLRGVLRGIPPTELRRQARVCLDTVRVRAACFECNDDQIHALSRQVRDDYGFDTIDVDADPRASREPLGHRAAGADLILTTRFHAADAQRLARRWRRPLLIATLDPAFLTRVRHMLAEGSVWWVCTDPRFTSKLSRMFPGADIKPVVLGRDPLDAIPRAAPVYATRRAADGLPRGWHGGRVVTIPHAFSSETARALVTFLVRRNLAVARAAARHDSVAMR